MSGNRLRFHPWLPAIVVALLFASSGSAGAGLADDPRDHGYVTVVVNRALETERTRVDVPWSNPSTGNRGVIVIERTFYRDPATPCREYRRTVERPGQPTAMVRGTGCRVGGGIWTLDETATGGASGLAPSAVESSPAEPPATPPASEHGRPTGGAEKAKPKAEARVQPPPPAKASPPPQAKASPPPPPPPATPPATATASPPSPSQPSPGQTPRVPGYTLPSKIPL